MRAETEWNCSLTVIMWRFCRQYAQDPLNKVKEELFMEQTFMKEKKILPLVLAMSLPMVISMAVNALYNIIDSYFIAKVSEDQITASRIPCTTLSKVPIVAALSA